MPDELSQEMIDQLLASASSDGGVTTEDLNELMGPGQDMDLPDFDLTNGDEPPNSTIEMLYDVELDVKIELGRTYMSVEDILKLREGSVIQLDKDAGAPVDILVNGRLVAFGEVLVLNDFFCVRVTEILSDRDRSIIKR